MSSCAICARLVDYPLIPWDDDGKLFYICRGCAFDNAKEGHGIERSYEGAGPSMSGADSTRGARLVMGAERYQRESKDLRQPFVMPAKSEVDRLLDDQKCETQRRRSTGALRSPRKVSAQARYKEKIGRVK